MKTFRKLIRTIFPSRKHLIAAVVIGLSITIGIYLGLLQRHFFSLRYLAYSFLMAFASILFSGWLNTHHVLRIIHNTPKKTRHFSVLFSFLFSLVLLFNTEIQPLYYTLPDSDLHVQFTIPDLPEGEEGVRLLWIKTGQGFVHYSRMEVDGQWERIFDNTVFPPGQNITLAWQGKVGKKAEIAFRQTEYDQPVEVTWNGISKTYNLNRPKERDVIIRDKFQIPFSYFIPFTLTFFIAVGYGVWSLLLLLASWDPGKVRISANRDWTWICFMLPMLAVWTFTLLIFWPGIMSNDSFAQWSQGITGQFNDWQSGFHAILLALLMRVWNSPAFIGILQIFFLALVAAWGLKVLQENGAPRIVLWGISILFAVFPSNGILSITIWKDIPYSIAFLWLTMKILKIIVSKSEWLGSRYNWIWLGCAAFLVAILRHNGVFVSMVCLLVLIVVYRKSLKPILFAIVTGGLLFGIAKGPLYSIVRLDRSSNGQSNLIYLHHIAAHLASGTYLEEEEISYLERFLPIKDWNYSCCYVGTISYDNSFDRQPFLVNTSQNRKLAFSLFARNPLVDIKHAFCSGELAWKFKNNECYMKSMHGINTWRSDREDWIIPNDFGLEDHSKLPELVDDYIRFLRGFGFLDDMLVFWLKPAFWLYVGAFSTAVAVIRRRDLHFLLMLLPALAQTFALIMVSFAPAYRYHYGTILVGMMLIGMAFMGRKEQNKRK